MTVIINGTDNSASTPAVTGTDGDTGMFYPAANTVALSTGGSERMRVDSDGDVGIGTTSPNLTNFQKAVTLGDGTGTDTRYAYEINGGQSNADSSIGTFSVYNKGSIVSRMLTIRGSADNSGVLTFSTSNAGTLAERARIDSSGNLLVGTTTLAAASGGSGTKGININADGSVEFCRNSDAVLFVNRTTSDGVIAQFRKNGTAIGAIGVRDDNSVFIGNFQTNDCALRLIGITNDIRPCTSDGSNRDNAIDIGDNSARFVNIYATNATIQTSDENEKQDIEELSETETRVAIALKGLLRKYRWKHRVATEGDDARIHFGIIAQDLQAAFEAEGLDAGRYSMFIRSVWWEKERVIPAVEGKEAVLDADGNVVEEAVEAKPESIAIDTFDTEEEAGEGAVRRERMGVRYNELLAFIIAAI